MDMFKPFCVLAAGLLSFAATAAPQVVPADPVQFERVQLRLTVDSCSFNKQSVSVELRGRTLVLQHQPVLCFAPGPPEVVDIQLGAFPAGDYRAELYAQGADSPSASIAFQVSSIAYVAVYPPLPYPIADYSGLWGTANEAGWGLSLHQGAQHLLFGALFVFDAQRQPQWYTLQAGSWQNTTRWTGQVVQSSGPPWTAATYPPDAAQYTPVGTATLDFGMEPGQEGVAKFTYSINGQTVSKTISRSRL
ncbi:hypothetical protein DFR29_103116 [Tahibacter aquaticus]|uniref:Uncharacterized protein n=1 Tax=Tahibacter aquaticus TaxID=520092 RepID=A0A4R6Z4J9_9GAMM|nr:hypothetical protein [Tahibacter aquaticus]TDR46582.1 hypothetical protein DFR29_103116 [Tahibacter aquaticus]